MAIPTERESPEFLLPRKATSSVPLLGLHQFDPVTERITGIEPSVPWNLLMKNDLELRLFETRSKTVEIVGEKGGVTSRIRGTVLYPTVKFLLTAREPHAAPVGQRFRLGNFRHSKNRTIEVARRIFPARPNR